MKAGLLLIAIIAIVACLSAADPVKDPPTPTQNLRLFAIPCGMLDYSDMAEMSDDGHFKGRKGELVVTCFLIQHPKGYLLWETGVPDMVRWFPWGYSKEQITMHLARKPVDSLKDIGLHPDDISYVGMSHLHFDHTGNAHEFPHATWILPAAELPWALGKPTPPGVYPPSLDLIDKVKRLDAVDGLDIFGDGTVKIVSTPGHTPDHVSLLLQMKTAGPVIIVGDLWHLDESRQIRAVPAYNTDRQATLASMDRVEAIAAETHARVIIGHDPADIAKLPTFPAYLE